MRRFLKALVGLLLGDYAPYFIYCWNGEQIEHANRCAGVDVRPLGRTTDENAADPLMRAQAGYAGTESIGFGAYLDGQLVGVCFYWYGGRYRQRNFWPLKAGEAKLVQIVVAPELRGRGVAPELIRCSALEMMHQGFAPLYARIWHSNWPSRRAFERAGWRRIAFVAEVNPLRRARPLRIVRTLR